ncbi:MAG: MoaD/ThiS family protein [Verrucomicrobia bacterium]|nr:MoaD/ThiS family protein [Verrucomicrobiota bacterium]
MRVQIDFYSYFKDLTGCARAFAALPPGSTIADLLRHLYVRFPKLAPMQRATLIAVGVEYQKPDYMLQDGDEVALFPPVQGG